jgi:S-adenosylmethionine:tRNA ribosyltransferase-isomerase
VKPATAPRPDPLAQRLLHVDPRAGSYADGRVRDLPSRVRPGDLLVVNDAATLPASLPATAGGGEPVEVRLAGPADADGWPAVLLGAGDWRTRTEDRPAPPPVRAGARLLFAPFLSARVAAVSDASPRLVRLAFDREGDALFEALYRIGRPVQYSYLADPLSLDQVQTAYGARPWAVEPPSAGRPLRLELLQALRRRGVATATVTHAAGLSATGDAELDARLPLPERYFVPALTVAAVKATRARGGRVLAVGTTVVRCLEGAAALHGDLVAGEGVTDLRVGPGFAPRVVDGLLTGVHEPGTSHHQLLRAFVGDELLDAVCRHAEGEGYLLHEFGDSVLVLAA